MVYTRSMKRSGKPASRYGKRTKTYTPYRPRTWTKSLLPMSRFGGGTYNFKRNYNFGDLPGNAAYNPYLAGNSFSFSQLPNATEFGVLFDQYKITSIKLRFYLTVDPAAQTAATAVFPRMWWAQDNDDDSAPASINDLRERSDVTTEILHPDKPVEVFLKPSVLSAVYRSAVSSSYIPKWGQFIDMSAQNVPHYGLKYGIDNLTNTNYTVRVEGTMWFQCRGLR
uniref:Capsid protein n=1 Tax=Sewage-associated circular DNA molecule TaxID=1592207 RepID=A0A0B4UHA3_9VIRU|nr:capsid protein [Sewage-associated circular DNA molecule]